MVQLSHTYMTTGKAIAMTLWTFVSKMMSLLFNTLSWFVIAFLLGSKCLLISWVQPLSAMILVPKKIKSVTASTLPLSICHEVMGPVHEVMNYGWRFVTLYRRQESRPSPRKRNAKKQNDCLRRPYK